MYRRAALAGDFRGQYNLGCMLAQIGRTAEAIPLLERDLERIGSLSGFGYESYYCVGATCAVPASFKAMKSAIAWVQRRTESSSTRSSKPWIESALGP